MDKRVYQRAGIVFAIFVLCTQTPLLSDLFAFMLLGMIPGTNLVIPSWVILLVYPALFLVTLYWLSAQQLFIGEITKPAAKTKRSYTKRKAVTKRMKNTKRTSVPKRRPRIAV